jgi:outer membrane protein OmpU
MNKLKTIGLSALAGSLAVTSAYAGELAVTGSAEVSIVEKDQYGKTGNPLGMSKAVSFSGSGELDNGWTMSVAHNMGQGAVALQQVDTSTVTFNMDTMGTLSFNQNGSAIAAMDDVMPTAWEESWDGAATPPQRTRLTSGTPNLQWTSAADSLPMGLTISATYAPEVGSGYNGSGSVSQSTGLVGSAWDVTLRSSALVIDGLSAGVGYAEGQNNTASATTAATSTGSEDDSMQANGYIKYAVGPVTIGYQESWIDDGLKSGTSTDANYYESKGAGIAFNVNDNLSISYNEYSSTKNMIGDTTADVDFETTAVDIAYSMGPLSVKVGDRSHDNFGYDTNTTSQKEHTELNISLAF